MKAGRAPSLPRSWVEGGDALGGLRDEPGRMSERDASPPPPALSSFEDAPHSFSLTSRIHSPLSSWEHLSHKKMWKHAKATPFFWGPDPSLASNGQCVFPFYPGLSFQMRSHSVMLYRTCCCTPPPFLSISQGFEK